MLFGLICYRKLTFHKVSCVGHIVKCITQVQNSLNIVFSFVTLWNCIGSAVLLRNRPWILSQMHESVLSKIELTATAELHFGRLTLMFGNA